MAVGAAAVLPPVRTSGTWPLWAGHTGSRVSGLAGNNISCAPS